MTVCWILSSVSVLHKHKGHTYCMFLYLAQREVKQHKRLHFCSTRLCGGVCDENGSLPPPKIAIYSSCFWHQAEGKVLLKGSSPWFYEQYRGWKKEILPFSWPDAPSKLSLFNYLSGCLGFFFIIILNGAEAIMDVIKIKHFTRLHHSVSMTCLTYTHFSSSPLFCCCHPSSLFYTSLSLTSALVAFALLLSFFLISPSTSLPSSHLSSSCPATSLPPFLPSLSPDLHHPPASPLQPDL